MFRKNLMNYYLWNICEIVLDGFSNNDGTRKNEFGQENVDE